MLFFLIRDFLWCLRVVFLEEGNSNFYYTLLRKVSFMSLRCIYASAFYFSPSIIKKFQNIPKFVRDVYKSLYKE